MSIRANPGCSTPKPAPDATPAKPRPIGSDFESISSELLLSTPGSPPWEAMGSSQVGYFQTGRQALTYIERVLSDRGINRLLVPAYLCDSMIMPFTVRNWEITPIPVDQNLSLDLERLSLVAQNSSQPFAVLMAEYFGRTPSIEYIDLANTLSRHGIPVIQDETHRPFRPDSTESEFSFCSLRKLLPIADGAYLRLGRTRQQAKIEPPFNEANSSPISEKKWAAMDLKLSSGSSSKLQSLLQKANQELEAQTVPTQISTRSYELLSHLDYTILAERRTANSLHLFRQLNAAGFSVVNAPIDDTVPSHLVVKVPNPKLIQAALAMDGIFCPIHWERSKLIKTGSSWADDIISIPIDHRYETADMNRIAQSLVRVSIQ